MVETITTAPRDGSYIMLWSIRSGIEQPRNGKWVVAKHDGISWVESPDSLADHPGIRDYSHWAPVESQSEIPTTFEIFDTVWRD